MLVGLRLVALVGAPVWVFAGAWLVGTKAGAVLTSGRPRARSRSGPDDAAPAPVDPFRTLALQRRLTALATEIDLLVADAGGVYARGVRLPFPRGGSLGSPALECRHVHCDWPVAVEKRDGVVARGEAAGVEEAHGGRVHARFIASGRGRW